MTFKDPVIMKLKHLYKANDQTPTQELMKAFKHGKVPRITQERSRHQV